MLFAVKVPEDERFCSPAQRVPPVPGKWRIPVVGKEPRCPLENPFSRTHGKHGKRKKTSLSTRMGLAKRLGPGYQAASAVGIRSESQARTVPIDHNSRVFADFSCQ